LTSDSSRCATASSWARCTRDWKRVDGNQVLVSADTIIVCAGQEPRRAVQGRLIGGAREAGELDAKRAMLEGAELAAAL